MKPYSPLRFSSVMLVLFFVTGSISLSAQSSRPATFDKGTKVVTLDTSVPFGYTYEIDISALGLGDKAMVESYFEKLETDLVTYEVKSDKQVQIQLNLRQHPDWSVGEWNKYLKSLAQK